MTFWQALRRTYGEAWRFLWAVPLLTAAIIGFEALQHVVEWRVGMYASLAAAKAAEHDAARMAAGLLKVAWLLVVQYWTARFVVSGGSIRQTFSPDRVALRSFGVVFAVSLVLAIVTLYLPALLRGLGAAPRQAALAAAAVMLAGLPVGVVFAPWVVGAALGDPQASPLSAVRRAGGSVLWGVGLMLAAVLPAMAIHYVLGLGAIGRAPGVAIAMLVADAVYVGFLGVLMNTFPILIAARMAARRGARLTLMGSTEPTAEPSAA